MKASYWTRLFDLIAPRPCAICGRRLSVTESLLCASCMLHLPLTNFQSVPLDNPMARLFWGRFPVERAAAFFYYGPQMDVSRVIHDLKYHGQFEMGEALGSIIARQFSQAGFFDGIDALVPMPITWKRRWKRGYNQCEMIAKGIREVTHLPIYDKVVKRTRFSGSQTDKHRWGREQNVEQAFALCDADTIAGKHVLLIDDIVTTGATITACAQQLCKAPGVKVSVLTLGFSKS